MERNTQISRSGDLLEAQVDGELIGLSVKNGTCYGFNATATRIWALICEPSSFGALCDALVQEYQISPEMCERDVEHLLTDLQRDGIVTMAAEASRKTV